MTVTLLFPVFVLFEDSLRPFVLMDGEFGVWMIFQSKTQIAEFVINIKRPDLIIGEIVSASQLLNLIQGSLPNGTVEFWMNPRGFGTSAVEAQERFQVLQFLAVLTNESNREDKAPLN